MSTEPQAYTLRGTDYITGSDLLLRWMGAFWTAFSDDPEFIKQYQRAKGLIAAQFEVWYRETAALSDRTQLPVYHRERWWPLPLTEATRNTGLATAVQLGSRYTGQIGPQTETPFIIGRQIEIGGNYPLAGIVSYPLPDGMADVVSVIVDDLEHPTILLIRNIDFYVENASLLFLHDTDPLNSGKFPTITTKDGTQALIWLCDALIDRNYVQNFAGYVLGLLDQSSEFYKRYLNALWDLYNKGATLTEFRAGIAAMLDEPSIVGTAETVEHILVATDKIQVVTDARVYQVQPTAELRDSVVAGAVLHRGELLTKTVQVWNNLDPSRITADNEYGATIQTDIPALLLPSTFFRARLNYGLGISWERKQVVSAGVDANGNAKLYFDLYGDPADVSAFWQDFWAYCEANTIAPLAAFGDAISFENGVSGYYGTIVPMEFFLANFLKANTLLITVDSDKLSDQGRQAMDNLVLLQAVVPKHVYVYVLERQHVGPEQFDTYEDAALVVDALPVEDVANPSGLVLSRLRYEDRVAIRWIPFCA